MYWIQDTEKGSTFSSDSGAILDVIDVKESRAAGHFSCKSSQSMAVAGPVSSGGGGGGSAGSRKGGDFGDSGLCLLSDTSSSSLMAPPPVPSKEKVLHWITNNDKWQEGDRDSSTKHRYPITCRSFHRLFDSIKSKFVSFCFYFA